VLALCVPLTSLVAGFSGSQPIIIFDAPRAGTTAFQGTVPLVISDSGEIAGYFVDRHNIFHGFIRSAGGEFTIFDAPGAGTGYLQGTQANGIGDHGKVVGYFYDANYAYHGFLRAANGTIITIDAPNAGAARNQGTNVTSINKDGESAGYMQDSNFVYHSFVRSSSGTFTSFDAPNVGTAAKQGTVLYEGGLNSQGKTCGFYFDSNGNVFPFIRKQSGVTISFDPLKSTLTFPTSINDGGITVGCALTADSCYGFIRNPDGALTTFKVPYRDLGTAGTQPNAISSSGVITGLFGDSNNITHGFVRSVDGVFSKFDAPGAGSVPGSYQGTTPESINSAGEIVGCLVDSNQVNHGFIRVPAP